ncbi:hypothetical protein TGAM01_v209718 [Trichoderma gamsii]|uniref:Uncharacterized protein n=1 Tax=Trichoderma gamsii TaxID=398673 RepID=A0A2P4ZAX4_9HYPO|nr:hypothetical protein TGAM01_v209718 [Trichoderma gamsii]PON21417.1 hypothetical protein TGAM01_v209718 [Trichoderma gamsii]
MQRPSPPVLLGPSPRRHHQRPSAAVWCSQLLTCFAFPASPRYLEYRRSKIRRPGRKSADALSPKRTGRVNATLVGTTFLDPRRPPSLGHLVIWTSAMACPVLYTPAAGLCNPCILIKNPPLDAGSQTVG